MTHSDRWIAVTWNPQATLTVDNVDLNLELMPEDLFGRGDLQEAAMTHWHDTMVDKPETDGAVYATGWTISGLAVLGTIVAVWAFGI